MIPTRGYGVYSKYTLTVCISLNTLNSIRYKDFILSFVFGWTWLRPYIISLFPLPSRKFSHRCFTARQSTLICLTWFMCPKSVACWQKKRSRGSSAACWAWSFLCGMKSLRWTSYRILCRTDWNIVAAWSECLSLLVWGKQVRIDRMKRIKKCFIKFFFFHCYKFLLERSRSHCSCICSIGGTGASSCIKQLKHLHFALFSFIAEIFNNTSYEILHRAYEKWCEEVRTSSENSCGP